MLECSKCREGMGIVIGAESRWQPCRKEWKRSRTWGTKEEVAETRAKVRSRHFEELLRKMSSSWGDRVACVVADATIGWAFEVAESMGIRRAMFWPTAVPGLVLSLSIPRLVEAGVIDDCGTFRFVLLYLRRGHRHEFLRACDFPGILLSATCFKWIQAHVWNS